MLLDSGANPAIAGVAGGFALCLAPQSSRVMISLFFFARAMEAAVRGGVARGVLPTVPGADVLLGMVSRQRVSSAALYQCFFVGLFGASDLGVDIQA